MKLLTIKKNKKNFMIIKHIIFELILIVQGVVYLLNPNIFRRWVQLKTSIAIKTMTPKKYETYMRTLGIIFIILGLALAAKDFINI